MSWRRRGVVDGAGVVHWAVARFAVWSALALVVLVLGIFLVSRQVARDVVLSEARDHARMTTPMVARLVDRDLRRHRPEADMPLLSVFGSRLLDGDLRHVRLWSRSGELIWADEEALIGRRYGLPPNVEALFGSEDVLAQFSAVDQRADGEEPEQPLLEVYAGGFDADGRPLVYEAYLPPSTQQRYEREIIMRVLPIAIGAVTLLQVAVLPLALLLARRVQRSEAARARLVGHALRASELERRRIARDLHDGVVQDLAGIGFVLPTLADELPDTPSGQEARSLMRRVQRGVEDGIAALRTLMVEVYPPDLERTGLETAVRTLAARTGSHGTNVEVRTSGDLRVPVEVARLAYRVVQEGLHNVEKHAHAAQACVLLQREDGHIVVEISDDGPGPGDPSTRPGDNEGHLGLQLLTEAVADAGGELSLSSRPEGGALLRAVIPLVIRASELV